VNAKFKSHIYVEDLPDLPLYLMYHLDLGLSLGHLHAFTKHHVNNWPAQRLKCFTSKTRKHLFLFYLYLYNFYFARCFL